MSKILTSMYSDSQNCSVQISDILWNLDTFVFSVQTLFFVQDCLKSRQNFFSDIRHFLCNLLNLDNFVRISDILHYIWQQWSHSYCNNIWTFLLMLFIPYLLIEVIVSHLESSTYCTDLIKLVKLICHWFASIETNKFILI